MKHLFILNGDITMIIEMQALVNSGMIVGPSER